MFYIENNLKLLNVVYVAHRLHAIHSLAEVEALSYGFRLGVRLMIEATVT